MSRAEKVWIIVACTLFVAGLLLRVFLDTRYGPGRATSAPGHVAGAHEMPHDSGTMRH